MTESTTPLTTQNGSLWWLDRPGGTLYLLCDIDFDDLAEKLAPITPLFHWNDDHTAQVAWGELIGPPDKITLSLLFPRQLARKIIEQGDNCPGALIWGQSVCGRPDDLAGIKIGEIVYPVKRSGRSFKGLTNRTDNPTEVSMDMEAWPPILDIDTLEMGRIATTEAQALNDVYGNLNTSCPGDCGDSMGKGQYVGIACDAAGGATGDELFSTDFGETFAIGAVDPFGVGLNTMAGVLIPYAGGRRWIVGREGTGAVQGLMAYSDNAGAAWTTVNIGGAAVGHGPTFGHGIFALDGSHIWVASHGGYIYKSVDSGLSYVAKEAAAIHAGDNHFVHFADKTYGLVGGAAGVISVSDDGGESWQAGAVPAASAARCGWRFNDRRCLVGLDNGALYESNDGAATWTLKVTGFPAGALRSMWFVNDLQGFIVHNTAAPVGSVWETINGGATWKQLVTPANTGLNSIWAPSANLAYVVGEVNAATGFIAKISSAYI